MRKPLYILALALSLSACTSLVEKGDKLYQQGLYQQAASLYEQALAEDAEDIKAQQGLAIARNKIVDRGLIEVRMLRLAGNFTGAAQKLETILRNQSKWSLESFGAQAATQSEELGHMNRWLRKEAKSLANSQQPDRFRWFESQYAYLLNNAQISAELTQYKAQLNQDGKSRCLSLAEHVHGQRFYLRQFVHKYCLAWQQAVSLKLDTYDQSRFKSVRFDTRLNLGSFESTAQRYLVESTVIDLRNAFQKSLWYTSQARQTAQFQFNTDITYERQVRHTQQEKRYLVTESRVDPQDSEKRIDVDIERVYIYPINEYQEYYTVRLGYKGMMAGQMVSHQHSNSEVNSTKSHTANYKEAEIKPLAANFLNLTDLLKVQLRPLQGQYISDLNALWKLQYCQHSAAESVAENALRCGKINPNEDFVNHWFRQEFGVDYKAMQSLYSL
ncbi:hypothetical protein PCIT_a3713 [Pseudoalteromonas citrea]|uniref:Tetratricopeptide repeat-containing protein n=2 Tax=Pseudoalteromonas citrea TaxID=43655 RepID=A0AAD4FQQ3_9GAMM|nr:hypothetical protein [Pseudoalteromonas citrea]KAF7767655.1 hypothetical protein PCIT_a3713 [Pseudoalteromonas citrea]